MTTKLPQVMGLVFCEEFDPQTFSLRRLFQGRQFSTFPTAPQEFLVYSALYGGSLEGTIELNCERMETETAVYRFREWRVFPGGIVSHWMHRLKRLRFPAPGRYSFKLLFDGTQLVERYLEIMRVK
jgi:hypothetical protein